MNGNETKQRKHQLQIQSAEIKILKEDKRLEAEEPNRQRRCLEQNKIFIRHPKDPRRYGTNVSNEYKQNKIYE